MNDLERTWMAAAASGDSEAMHRLDVRHWQRGRAAGAEAWWRRAVVQIRHGKIGTIVTGTEKNDRPVRRLCELAVVRAVRRTGVALSAARRSQYAATLGSSVFPAACCQPVSTSAAISEMSATVSVRRSGAVGQL